MTYEARIWTCAAVAACALGMASKETMLTAPNSPMARAVVSTTP